MGKKPTLEEMKKKYEMMPTESRITEIDGTSYTVVSHYIGSKDIDDIIRALAEKQAYEAIEQKKTV